jgi:glycosyltransferase involved in cell wall biosynthesis
VEPGRTALAHPPGDAAALAAQIALLVERADLRASLGREGRAEAERRFDRSRLAETLAPLYQRLCVSFI